MTTTQHTHETHHEPEAGFPIEAKIALGVIALGLAALILKVFGVF